jgi:energy-coupling factor transporter ATP-binding protein EcfA2
LDIGTILLLVGPNNSGKSTALREIEQACTQQKLPTKVVDSMTFEFPDDPDVALALARVFESPKPSEPGYRPENLSLARRSLRAGEVAVGYQTTVQAFKDAITQRNLNVICPNLTGPYTIRLDGRTRFSVVDPQTAGDLLTPSTSYLEILLKDNPARERISKLTAEAFHRYFVIDPTGMRSLRIRMSPEPLPPEMELSLDTPAREFYAKTPLINDLGDGVQSFVALVASILSMPHKIILIEDPEAFLHPPLARRLGVFLASVAHERNASLVVATHSADFVIGCMEAVANTSIVRLTYDQDVASARSLSPAEVATMARAPLLRSAGILTALFHRAVIATESDTDRALYDEINHRLLAVNRGIKDTLFLNGHGWHSIHQLVGPLRRIGIPAAAIADLDALSNGGGTWARLLDGCQVPATVRTTLEPERTHIAAAFSAIPTPEGAKKPIKRQGIAALSATDQVRATVFLESLASYGLFLVPVGEVESWLPALGVHDHGPDWLMEVFSHIGQSETDVSYVRPGPDDVWQFLDRIATWVDNPMRLGVE